MAAPAAFGGGIFSSGALTLQNGTLIQSNYASGGDNGWPGMPGSLFHTTLSWHWQFGPTR
jgi:hypothetical protein